MQGHALERCGKFLTSRPQPPKHESDDEAAGDDDEDEEGNGVKSTEENKAGANSDVDKNKN